MTTMMDIEGKMMDIEGKREWILPQAINMPCKANFSLSFIIYSSAHKWKIDDFRL